MLLILAACGCRASDALPPPRATATATLGPISYPACSFFGDSLAAGYHLVAPAKPFPALTINTLRAAGRGCTSNTVVAFGGWRADMMLPYLQQQHIQPASDLLIVEFGNNEFAPYTPAQTESPGTFNAAYRNLLAYLVAKQHPAALVCTWLWRDPTWKNTLGYYPSDYNAIITDACAAYGGTAAHTLDLTTIYAVARYHGGPTICCGDTYHPNELGQQAIANALSNP